MRLTVFRDGRIPTIERSLSAGVLGPSKSGRTRRVTLGPGTADTIRRHFQAWAARAEPEEDRLFSPSPTEAGPHDSWRPLPPAHAPGAGLGRRHAALHRLRHSVATYLVDQRLLLNGQARLGHRDPATTLRHYSHAIPLDDTDVADQLDGLLNGLDPKYAQGQQ